LGERAIRMLWKYNNRIIIKKDPNGKDDSAMLAVKKLLGEDGRL